MTGRLEDKMTQDYEYLADLHTHTVASGHAHNSIREMVDAARSKGITLFGITDHAVTMPGTCDEEYFRSLKNINRNIYEDIEVCLGVELNIIDITGRVDMSVEDLWEMEVTIASIHNTIGYTAGSKEQNTGAVIGAMKNPLINIIGHPDDGRVPLDYEAVVKASKEYGTLLELNNNSMASGFRENARENDAIMLSYCKKYGVPVVIGSDAHAVSVVARHDSAMELLKEIGFDQELVLNYFPDRLRKYLNKYRR